MGFLRRLLGGGEPPPNEADAEPRDHADLEADEREHELDLLRGEQQRLDELTQRQLRYSQYAWQPPAQGGDRRADDKVEDNGG